MTEGDPRTAPDICESSLVGVRFIRWERGLPRWRDGQWVLPRVKGRPLMVRSATSDPEKSRGVSGISYNGTDEGITLLGR